MFTDSYANYSVIYFLCGQNITIIKTSVVGHLQDVFYRSATHDLECILWVNYISKDWTSSHSYNGNACLNVQINLKCEETLDYAHNHAECLVKI